MEEEDAKVIDNDEKSENNHDEKDDFDAEEGDSTYKPRTGMVDVDFQHN